MHICIYNIQKHIECCGDTYLNGCCESKQTGNILPIKDYCENKERHEPNSQSHSHQCQLFMFSFFCFVCVWGEEGDVRTNNNNNNDKDGLGGS